MTQQLESFKSALLTRLMERKNSMGLTYFDKYAVTSEETPKYYKIYSHEIKNDVSNNKSIVAFVEKVNGNILKPATYKVPAKHARGNINSPSCGMEAISHSGCVIYLK